MLTSRRLQLAVGGVMLLLSTALVVGLVALGNRPLGRGFVAHVDFDYVDALQEGAEVRISALRVGRVLDLRPGVNVTAGEPPLRGSVRVDVWLRRDLAHLIRRSSVFYVNSKGVIGERYLEVGPPPDASASAPALARGDVVRGVDFPKLDRMLQFGFENLRAMVALAAELRPEIHALGRGTARLRERLRQDLPESRVDALLARLDAALNDARGLQAELERAGGLALARRAGSAVVRAVERTRAGLGSLPPVGLPEEIPPAWGEELGRAMSRLQAALARARDVGDRARRLLALVRGGKGTVGRILADPELADEIKETHRILKNNPWKALGRPPRRR